MGGKYQAYDEYRGSGVKWLGQAPKQWALTRAKNLFQRVQREVCPADGIITAFRDGQVTLRSNRRNDGFTNALKEIGYQGVREGDLLVHAMDGFAGAIGISDSNGKCSPVCSVCIPKKPRQVYMPFFGYQVRQLAVTDFITSLAKGIRERSTEFRYNEFSVLELAVPTLFEQKKIADFLDHETSKIDELIEKQQRLIKLLKEKRQAVISHAVTKGLNPTAPMRPSGVEWLGDVPEHWEVVPLKYLCKFSGGGTPSKDNLSYWTDGRVLWVSPKDMKSHFISNTQDKITMKAVLESSTNLVEGGALLMVVRSGILQRKIPIAINTVQVTLNQDMKALRFNSRIDVQYAANFILGHQNSLLLEWSKEGATVESIEHEYLVGSCFPVPPVEEQIKINDFIKEKIDVFQHLEVNAHAGIRLLKERRTALISAAVTGKIDVRGWEPPTATTSQEESTA